MSEYSKTGIDKKGMYVPVVRVKPSKIQSAQSSAAPLRYNDIHFEQQSAKLSVLTEVIDLIIIKLYVVTMCSLNELSSTLRAYPFGILESSESEKGRLQSLRQLKTKTMRIMKTAEPEMKTIFIG